MKASRVEAVFITAVKVSDVHLVSKTTAVMAGQVQAVFITMALKVSGIQAVSMSLESQSGADNYFFFSQAKS